MLSESQRKLRASLAGQTGWGNTIDRAARGRNAQRGLREKFYHQTDPNLPEHVRAQQAEAKFKAHMKRLAFNSVKSRQLKQVTADRLAAQRKAARQAEQLDGGVA